MSSAPRFRPTIGRSYYHKTNIVTVSPIQMQQPLEQHEEWSKLTTCSDIDQNSRAGIFNKMACGIFGSQSVNTEEPNPVLRQHNFKQSIQEPFQQPNQQPVLKPFETPYRQLHQQPLRQPIQHLIQTPFRQPLGKPFLPPIQTEFQPPTGPKFQKPFQQPIQSFDRLRLNQSTQMPLQQSIAVANQPATKSNLQYEPTTQRVLIQSRQKNLRGNFRQKHRGSSSTRPPYPKGIKPDKEQDDDYNPSIHLLCDEKAVCQKHEWTKNSKK